VHKSIGTRPVAVEETLLRDSVEVRHVAIDKIVPCDQAPAARQEGDTLIVPVLEEVLVVEKRVRIREELHITRHRHATRHSETVTLQAESVTVTPLEAGTPPKT
jgi:stress response protein YsnF